MSDIDKGWRGVFAEDEGEDEDEDEDQDQD